MMLTNANKGISIVVVAVLWMALPLWAGGELVLKDGAKVRYDGETATEQNMVVLTTEGGERLLLGKGLVDWEATWQVNPDLVVRHRPAIARDQAEKDRLQRPEKPVVLTNDTLSDYRRRHLGRSATGNGASGTITGSPNALAAGSHIKTITHGDEVTLTDHVDAQRLLLVDFYADWCGPCRMFTPRLVDFAERYPDHVVIVKVDIVKWGSPVATQYDIKSIPYVRVYDERGKLLKKDSGNRVLTYLKAKARKEKW